MTFIELLLIGIGLSMDAFAAAICRGLVMKKFRWNHALIIALFFGGFQAAMPLAGWLLGSTFSGSIQEIDHWIAFVLLGLIGINMIREAMHEEDEKCDTDTLRLRELLILAIATSVDALAIGVTFAFLRVDIIPAISLIGVTTFLCSLLGVTIGHFFGAKHKKKAEVAGGIVLILLGTKILLEHLGILP